MVESALPLVESPTGMDSSPLSASHPFPSSTRSRSESKHADKSLHPRHPSSDESRSSVHRSHTVDHPESRSAGATESRSRSTPQSSSTSNQNPSASRYTIIGSTGPNSGKASTQTRVHPVSSTLHSLSPRIIPTGVSSTNSVHSVAEHNTAAAATIVTDALRRALPRPESHPSPFAPSQPSTSSHAPPNHRMHPSPHAATISVSASVSASRKSSGTNSDREANGHLDLKRLLSKPAALSNHSSSSIISIPSDPESPFPSASPATRRALTDPARPHKMSVTGPSVPREKSPTKPATAPASRSQSVSGGSLRPPRTPPKDTERESKSKSRNVLRRKASAHSNPSTPTAATFQMDDAPQTPRASSSKHNPRASEPSGSLRSSYRRPVTQPATATPVGSLKSKETSPPRNLTPAGAVALEYKQQEQRREELERITEWGEQRRESHRHNMMSISSRGEGEEDSAGPYYTLFGSSSERVITAKEDEAWGLSFDTYYGAEDRLRSKSAVVISAGSGSQPGSSGVRGLSRKVSGRFRKVAGAVTRHHEPSKSDVETPVYERSWTPFDGRPIPEHTKQAWSPGDVRDKASLASSSTDKMNSPDSLDSGRDRHKKHTHSPRSPTTGEESPRSRHREEESLPGGKLWKLMKRISTGGLRDKYHRESAPPPVPELPKNLRKHPSSRATLDIQKPQQGDVGETGVLLTKFMSSRSSMSAVRPSTMTGSKEKEKSSHDVGSRPSTGKESGSPSTRRPSSATRSSSPISSEFASPRFQKSHSNRSSTSSYGEEIPPLPSSPNVVGQHIVPPDELMRMDKDGGDTLSGASKPRRASRSRSMPGEESGFNSADEALRPSLPIPPRRPATSSGSQKSGRNPHSPTIPTFSPADSVETFPQRSGMTLSMSEFGEISNSENTPPRPPRSSRRHPAPLNLGSSLSSHSHSASQPSPTPSTPRKSILPSLSIDLVHRTRKSLSGTSHKTSPSTTASPQSSSTSHSHTRSPLTFRELETPRQQLTEKEKADKWEDLLARSEQAGGTLHIGESGLMSDNIRFSAFGEL